MRRKLLLPIFVTSLLALAACGDDDNNGNSVACGEGTVLQNNQCVPADSNNGTNNGTNNGDNNGTNNGTNNGGVEITCGPGTQLEGTECVLVEEPVECGEGTSLVDGACVADPVDPPCGDGTELVGGACVPVDDLCDEGQARDNNGDCVALESLCGDGTVFMDGGCQLIDPLADVDQFETDENNDPFFGGTPGELVLGGPGEVKLVQGVIGAASDLDGDEETGLEPDFDVFVVQGTAGQRLRLQGTAVGAPGIAFAVTFVPAPGQEDPGFVRLGLPFEDGRNAVREVVLPWDGAYEIRVGESRNLTTFYGLTDPVGDWYGGEGYSWIFGAEVLEPVAPTEQNNGGFEFEGDLAQVPQVQVNLPGYSIVNLSVATNNPAADAGVVLVTSPVAEGSDAPVAQIGGGLAVVPEGGLTVTVDHIYNATADKGFTLTSVPVANTDLGEVATDGTPATLEEPAVLVSNNFQFYHFTVTEPSVVSVAATPEEGSPANLLLFLTDTSLAAVAQSGDDLFGAVQNDEFVRAYVEPGTYIVAVAHEEFIGAGEVFEGAYNVSVSAAPVVSLDALAQTPAESSAMVAALGGVDQEAWMRVPVEALGDLAISAAPGANLDVQAWSFTGDFLQARDFVLSQDSVDNGGAGEAESFGGVTGPTDYLIRVANVGEEATEDAGVTVTATLVNEFDVVVTEEPANNEVAGAGALGTLVMSPVFANGVLGEDALEGGEALTDDYYTFSIEQGAALINIQSFAYGDSPAEYAYLEVFEAGNLEEAVAAAGDPGFDLFGIPPTFGVLDVALAQGDYVLKVSSLTGPQGGYALAARFVEEYECVPGVNACLGDDVEVCTPEGTLATVTCGSTGACASYGAGEADCSSAAEVGDNNSQETAAPIVEEGEIMDGRYAVDGMIETGLRDFYSFTVGANGALVTAGTLPQYGNDATMDTVLTILDANGVTVASNDDSPGAPGLYSLVEDVELPAGTYTVRVEDFGNNGAGVYRLFIDVQNFLCPINMSQCEGNDIQVCDGEAFVTTTTCEDGCGVDEESGEARCLTFPATEITLFDGNPLGGEFVVGDEEMFYEFEVTGPITLTFETSAGEDPEVEDTQMWLCDNSDPFNCGYGVGNGNLAYNDDIGFPNYYSRFTYFFDTPGTYYVGVRSFSDGVGTYSLSITEQFEPNQNAMEAVESGSELDIDGDEVIARLPEGDVDWYVVDVSDFDAPASVLFRLFGVEGTMMPDTRIWLCDDMDPANCTYDAGNLAAANNEGGFESLEYLFAEGGLFYVAVDAVGSTGHYRLTTTVTEEPNDDAENAVSVNVPSSTIARLTSGDVDWFTFSVEEAPQNIIFATEAVEGEMMVNTRLWICDMMDPANCTYDAGNLAANDDDGDMYGSLDYTFEADGDYFVVVEATEGTGWYNLILTPTEEPNESADTAIELFFGEPFEAALQNDADLDWFAFEVAEADVNIPMYVETVSNDGSMVDTVLWVCDDAMNCAMGTNLGENDDAEEGTTFSRVEFTPGAMGTYYAVVSSSTGSTGDYLVWFNEVGEPENGTPEGAIAIDVPGMAAGRITPAGDVDRYVVEITEPGTVIFRTGGAEMFGITDTQMALCAVDTPDCSYGSSVGRLASNDDQSANPNGRLFAEITYEFTEAGVYMVVVKGYSTRVGGYTFETLIPEPPVEP